MDQRSLEKLILTVIRASFATTNPYPDPPAIRNALLAQGVDVTPEQVLGAISSLEKTGKVARAPHYYVTGN